MSANQSTILYDSGCRLCLGAVSFIRKRDHEYIPTTQPLKTPIDPLQDSDSNKDANDDSNNSVSDKR